MLSTCAAEETFNSSTTGAWSTRPTDSERRCHYLGQTVHPRGVDVSHDCTNIAPDAGQRLHDISRIGDRVTVKITGSPLTWGDGWTDRNREWDEYVKRSAIPYTPAAPSPASSHR
jgi:hypothetical protein